MNKIQKHFIDLIYEDLVREYPTMKNEPTSKIYRFIFKNERNNTGQFNLRLSLLGFTFLSKRIKFFNFTIKDEKMGMKELIWLDRTQKYPYHYNDTSKTFYTASPNLSMLLKLSDCSFEAIIKN